jgi:hypothetical protein
MIEAFTKAWFANLHDMRAKFEANHPDDYKAVVKAVVEILPEDGLTDEDGGWAGSEQPDPERIHEINDGDYQGTLVYVIGAKGYQPSTYWFVRVGYGSCSGCDTLEAIRGYRDDKPDKDQVDQYMKLALDVVQGLRRMGGPNV